MKRTSTILLSVALLGIAGVGLSAFNHAPSETSAQANAVVAQTETATFDIENMTCATCPITVRTAMSRVEGVDSVEVDFETKTAIVRFDASVTTAALVGQASTDAGYPAHASNAEDADQSGAEHQH